MGKGRNKTDFLKKLYLIAYEYYINRKTQQEIADQLGTNRVLISRYLKQARELGLVEIKLRDPFLETEIIKEKLIERFELKDVFITPFPFYEGGKNYHIGASLVGQILDELLLDGVNVGIGWGSTMEIISKNLVPTKKLKKTTFVPMTGGTNQLPHYFRTNDFVRNFSESYEANAKYLFAPFYVEDPLQKEYLLASDDLKEIIEIWKKLDIAIVGIGCYIQKSPLFQNKIFDEKYLKLLLESNVVGDVLTHFFDEEGVVINLEIYKYLVNISLDDFLKIDLRIGIAGGLQKVQSIIGALRGRLINVLITDMETAEMILKNAQKKRKFDSIASRKIQKERKTK